AGVRFLTSFLARDAFAVLGFALRALFAGRGLRAVVIRGRGAAPVFRRAQAMGYARAVRFGLGVAGIGAVQARHGHALPAFFDAQTLGRTGLRAFGVDRFGQVDAAALIRATSAEL